MNDVESNGGGRADGRATNGIRYHRHRDDRDGNVRPTRPARNSSSAS